MYYLTVSGSQASRSPYSQLILLSISHEGAIEMLSGAASFEASFGVGQSNSKKPHSGGCWREASVLCHMGHFKDPQNFVYAQTWQLITPRAYTQAQVFLS